MFKKLIIAHMPMDGADALVTLLLENNRPAELSAADCGAPSILGNIYLGRIETLQNSLSAAFVRIRPDQTAFLPLPEDHAFKPGDELLVQVEREDVKEKLPRLTTKLTFPGKYLVFCSQGKGVTFSKKLGLEDRKRIQKILHRLIAPGAGVLARTAASEASEEQLRREYFDLERQMVDVQIYGTKRTCYSCLRQSPEEWMQMLDRCRRDELSGVTTDDPEIYDRLVSIFLKEQGRLPSETEVRLYADRLLPLYKLYNMTTLLTELTSKTVYLKSGGSVVIEQTEAFVAIDVNTGRYAGNKNAKETKMLINREAAAEIASQIRLRQLSGTILIDFIGLKDRADREEITELMRRCLAADADPAKVIDITALDIMELTRSRRHKSLKEQLTAIYRNKAKKQDAESEHGNRDEEKNNL